MQRSNRNIAILAAPFLVLSLSACPSEDPGTEEDKFDELIETLAARFSECMDEQLGFASQLDPDFAAAVRVNRADAKRGLRATFEQMRDSERVSYREEHLDDCIDELERSSCERLLSSSTGPEACVALFQGTAEEGEECAFDSECADGHCAGASNERCGACAPYAKEGEPCDGDAVCATGLTCNFAGNGTDLVCEKEEPTPPAPKKGDSCNPQSGCGNPALSGLVCLEEGGSATCVDVSVVALGGECELFGQPNARRFCKGMLSTTYCDVDFMSGATTGTCVERPSVGEACNGLALCNSFEAECVDEVCVAVAAVGEACDENDGPSCTLGASCQEGVCRVENTIDVDPAPICGD